MISNKTLELKNCKLELTKKTNRNGIIYYATDLVLENGEKRQIGFAIDFYVIRKLLKKGVNEQ